MNRQDCNREILKILSSQVEKYPEMRFMQMLEAYFLLEIYDRLSEESNKTLKELTEIIEENL